MHIILSCVLILSKRCLTVFGWKLMKRFSKSTIIFNLEMYKYNILTAIKAQLDKLSPTPNSFIKCTNWNGILEKKWCYTLIADSQS